MRNLLIVLVFIIFADAVKAQESGINHAAPAKTSRTKKHRTHTYGKDKIHYGTASFYANKFEGHQTANGEIFSQKKFTAASNTLRLNEWVKVTNVHNKMSVIVQITDRMHKNNKRLIDLSKAAAKKLRYTGNGLASVRVEDLGNEKPKDAFRD